MNREVTNRIKDLIIEVFDEDCGDELEDEKFETNMEYARDVILEEYNGFDIEENLDTDEWDELEDWFVEMRRAMYVEKEERFLEEREVTRDYYNSVL